MEFSRMGQDRRETCVLDRGQDCLVANFSLRTFACLFFGAQRQLINLSSNVRFLID